MTAQTRTRWRNTTGIVAICLAGALFSVRPPGPGGACTTVVYVRTGPGRYQEFSLEGGP